MFHRIVVDIIDVLLEIAIVTDGVLPKPTLPKRSFGVCPPSERRSRRNDCIGEATFDQAPSHGEVGVAVRQSHDDVEVMRQHDDGVDVEGVASPDQSYGSAQRREVIDQHTRHSISEGRSDEKRAAGKKIPSIADMSREYPGFRYAQSGLRLLPPHQIMNLAHGAGRQMHCIPFCGPGKWSKFVAELPDGTVPMSC
jgi:hypothetical protein